MSVRVEWMTATATEPTVLRRGAEAEDGQEVTAPLALDLGPVVIEGEKTQLVAFLSQSLQEVMLS